MTNGVFSDLGIPDELISAEALALYEAMLTSPHDNSRELATKLGVTKAEIEDLASELISARLLVGQGPWQPVDPVTPLRKLITDAEMVMAAVRDRRDELGNLEQRLSRAYGFHLERNAEDRAIEVIHGVRAASERLHALGHSGIEYCLAMTPGPGLHKNPEDLEETVQEELGQLARGMEHRNIVDWQYLEDPRLDDRMQRLSRAGAHYRVTREVPIRCVIAPTHVALPIAADDDGAAGVMIMHASSIVRVAAALFEFIWAQSTPIPFSGRARSGGDSSLLDDEWSLLDYLATGMPDDAIARNLDVSTRTVRRRIGELADKLGAASRFQLAVRAAAHGWHDGSERQVASTE